MSRVGTLGLSVVLAVGSGCASFTKGIRPDEKLAPDSAYLYGRFVVRSEKHALAMDGYQTMGFVVHCEDKKTYTVRFGIEDQVQVFKVSPSRCAFAEMVYTDGDGAIRGRRVPPLGWRRPIDVAPGRAYYLGDYLAQAQQKSSWKVLYTELHLIWDMDPIDGNYESTTAAMKRTFAALAPLPTEDRRLIPSKRYDGLAEGARARPADVPSPSPERVARMAGLTKSRYATPAECQAGCRSGQCLPFRSEAGPAMTCVVYCRADNDCPDGLTCYCPTGGGPGCGRLGEAADEKVASICLPPEGAGGAAEQP